jgi:ribose 5-phosphate isomerase A
LNLKQDLTEIAKKNAAKEAAKHVKDGYIVGLGSGSTTAYAIEEIAKKMKKENLRILGIPTSYQAFTLAVKKGIPITTLEEHPTTDLTIDGADQIDPDLNLIKGMGGALTREKIVAQVSKKSIIVADESKKVRALGQNEQPIPIEVVPFAIPLVLRRISEIGGKPVLREGRGKVGPVLTDNFNAIIDATFGPLDQPSEMERTLKSLTGVVETGLFVETTNLAYIGKKTSVEKLVARQK